MSAEHDAIAAAIEDIDPGWDLAGLLTHALNDLAVEQVVEVLASVEDDE